MKNMVTAKLLTISDYLLTGLIRKGLVVISRKKFKYDLILLRFCLNFVRPLGSKDTTSCKNSSTFHAFQDLRPISMHLQVHSGFLSAYDSVRTRILSLIKLATGYMYVVIVHILQGTI